MDLEFGESLRYHDNTGSIRHRFNSLFLLPLPFQGTSKLASDNIADPGLSQHAHDCGIVPFLAADRRIYPFNGIEHSRWVDPDLSWRANGHQYLADEGIF